jgi:hypothetical protein
LAGAFYASDRFTAVTWRTQPDNASQILVTSLSYQSTSVQWRDESVDRETAWSHVALGETASTLLDVR